MHCGKSYSQLTWGDPDWTDYSVTIRVRAGNAATNSYGIFARYQDGTHYYQLLLQVGSILQLNKQMGRPAMESAKRLSPSTIQIIIFLSWRSMATTLKIVNGINYIDYTDDDPSWGGLLTWGKAGIYSEINGYFNDLAVASVG